VRITRADGLITRAEAAALCGVRPDTISQWISRGYQTRDGQQAKLPVAKREGRTVLLEPVEVQKAEYATAVRARRLVEPEEPGDDPALVAA
jgi:hypothetical protein